MKPIAILAFASVVSVVGLFGAPAMAEDITALMGGQTITEDELTGLRAKGADSITDQAAVVSNDNGSIIGNTGLNGVTSSFQNAQGLIIVGQNSGNNVSFQQAITMTVRVGN